MQFKVSVQREGVAKPGFSPQSVQAQIGDSVFWFNADRKTKHQPYLVSPGDWAANPIDPREPSTQVNTDQAGTFHYRCAVHPDEVGVVLVCTAVMIGPVGDGTSAFSIAGPQPTAGTSVSFSNADSQQHWPMPQSGPQDAWFQAAINPGDISAPVPFNAVENINFQCAIHPSETGILTVTADPVTVSITSGPAQFSPQFLQIMAGQAVTFSNQDSSPHQPAPDGGPAGAWFPNPIPAAPNPQNPVNAAYTFTTPGTYWYQDALNPNLKGIIQVGQS